jgi:hypothetical protein
MMHGRSSMEELPVPEAAERDHHYRMSASLSGVDKPGSVDKPGRT